MGVLVIHTRLCVVCSVLAPLMMHMSSMKSLWAAFNAFSTFRSIGDEKNPCHSPTLTHMKCIRPSKALGYIRLIEFDLQMENIKLSFALCNSNYMAVVSCVYSQYKGKHT